MRISFHGAAGQVTGSCHLVEANGRRILIDCGMFHGGRELDEENAEPFGFEPASIDVLLLTHAHLDHCGRIPLLVRRGFVGEIVSTAATRDLTRIVLADSARLHEEDARRRRRHRGRKGDGDHGEPLYDTLDAFNAFDRFGRTARYRAPIDLGGGVSATFFDAGHILGSAGVLIETAEPERRRRAFFSGDIGPPDGPLLRPDAPPTDLDALVMETTYGDHAHRSRAESVAEFLNAIGDAHGRGGNVVIPTFALERAQELLFHLREGVEQGALPKGLRIFLDSPMAISATRVFEQHPECQREDVRQLFAHGADPFRLPGLHFVRESAESMRLNEIRSGAVIMAGSGMCTGGRVRHHLRHNLGHANCSVVFVGFAAKGTPARQIIDGAQSVRIFGDDIPVRARIHTINGFSAHADRDQLLAWRARTGGPALTILVHGEAETAESFAAALGDDPLLIPKMGQSVAI
jgi:metallo-beta-lactamase family protein